MSDTPAPTPSAPPAAPQAFILSYVANTGSSTRVRSVSRTALLVMMSVYIVVGLWGSAACILAALRWVGTFRTGFLGAPWSWKTQVEVFLRFLSTATPFWILFPLLVIGVLGVPAALRVGRGSRRASLVSIALALPALGGALILAALGYVEVVGGFIGWGSPHAPLWLLAGVAMTFLSLLLFDLISFLLWIARNPVSEMPKRPFV